MAIYEANQKFRDLTREIDAKMQSPDHHQVAAYAAQRACDNSYPSEMAAVAVRTYRDTMDGLAKQREAQPADQLTEAARELQAASAAWRAADAAETAAEFKLEEARNAAHLALQAYRAAKERLLEASDPKTA